LKFPGKLGIGYHSKYLFDCTCDTINHGLIVPQKTVWPTEIAADATVDPLDVGKFTARLGSKCSLGKDYTMQFMVDQDFKVSSAFSYAPLPNFKFTWSDNCDCKKLINDPAKGFYTYGFTVEFLSSV
jgi:hypothetical protein